MLACYELSEIFAPRSTTFQLRDSGWVPRHNLLSWMRSMYNPLFCQNFSYLYGYFANINLSFALKKPIITRRVNPLMCLARSLPSVGKSARMFDIRGAVFFMPAHFPNIRSQTLFYLHSVDTTEYHHVHIFGSGFHAFQRWLSGVAWSRLLVRGCRIGCNW